MLGFRVYWGSIRIVLGLYGNNGQETGNYYLGFRVCKFHVCEVAESIARRNAAVISTGARVPTGLIALSSVVAALIVGI